MSTLPVKYMGTIPQKGLERGLVVTDPNAGEVRVRWQLGREEPWRCSECGPMAEAACVHTFAAGLALAETVLGLTRLPEYLPRGTEIPTPDPYHQSNNTTTKETHR